MMAHIDGEVHGECYWSFANQKQQDSWNSTFVKGKGYKSFEGVLTRQVVGMMDLVKQANERKGEL